MKRVKLSEITEHVRNGKSIKNSSDGSGLPITRIETISDGTFNENKLGYGGVKDLDKIGDYWLQDGDILMSHINSPKHLGKAALYTKNDLDIIHGMNLLGIRPITSEVIPEYLNYYFLSKDFDSFIKSISNQSVNQASFAASKLKKLEVTLPSLSEQKAIVAKLDRAKRLIHIDKEMLAKYDELIQSVFLEMFGDPVTNPKGWDRVVFSNVFDITTGKLNANEAVEDGEYPFFTCAREISWIDDYAFDTEALLLAGNNASGDFNIKHYKGKFNAYQRTYVLTSEENYGFLKIALDNFLNQMKSDSIGTNTKYLTLKLLDRINIPIPPRDLQNNFNQIVTKIDEEKRIINHQQIKKSKELFSSLVQGAFG